MSISLKWTIWTARDAIYDLVIDVHDSGFAVAKSATRHHHDLRLVHETLHHGEGYGYQLRC